MEWMVPLRLLVPFLGHLLLISHLAPSISADPSSHGCYWTESCQNKWLGGCGAGYAIADQSDNCNGLCEESSYPPCLPFHTHFHCCKPESPRVTNRCARCQIKLDFGDEYICCTDCSDPYLIDKSSKLGYCKSGAELTKQLKPQEIFKWVAGPWMKCSSPCDGGVRYRDVGCFGSNDYDASIKHYPVDDSRCSAEEMDTEFHKVSIRVYNSWFLFFSLLDRNLAICIAVQTSASVIQIMASKGGCPDGWLYYLFFLDFFPLEGLALQPTLVTSGEPQPQAALYISCLKDILESLFHFCSRGVGIVCSLLCHIWRMHV
ncbi:uncharacterized protein [Elaeis guineensis]|uniref:Uncharacterized protein LOC105047769 isoform X1 n=1 Tax=Elaeis guineensis var. tenera TaxID=51953 RepID=A0A8N4F558_ELAGV|nr:uncharacterized protein LOC105047769 isoform X1 [Elaeis guineensis]XP_029121174.1 uncharacterized protein LOC105047769 isoform X1 [Elaeis guineensis]XP_029121175.1 uncharacterized protein LOC105047769 isoform X1 [Elaeis guineensis]